MEESDKILYHYTSLEGILGIIESNSIWATNILYLNDASELNYAEGLLREQVLNFQKGLGNAFMPEYMFFQSLMKNIEYFFVRNDFFVCSFSEKDDLLSQWRGYCPRGTGFSLGFKFSKLKECVIQQNFSIMRCSYDENEQIGALRKLIEQTSLRFRREGKPDWEVLSIELIIEFIKLAPTFKHPKFKEENEWRIIANLFPPGAIPRKYYELINFRPGQSMVVPYIKISLPKEGENLLINKIVVGPTHDPNLSKASVEMLLRSKNVNFDEVNYSTIPYRNW
jgi:hypothetical protein